MNFAIEFPFFVLFKVCLCLRKALSVLNKHIVFFFFFKVMLKKKKNKKKKKPKLCESGNVVIVFARKMCNIRFSDGSRFQRRTPIFHLI